MYDTYLYRGCKRLPNLDDLRQQIPELADSLIQQRLIEPSPGFLGFSLPISNAQALLRVLGRASARGLYVPSAYRQPQVTLLMAHTLAEQAAVNIQAASFPEYDFAPVTFLEEDAMWWIFFTSSQKLGEEGHIPGGFYVYIDKLDGHVWDSKELDQVFAILEDMQYQ